MEEKKEGFFVEKILFKHKFGSELKYLIKWEGYPIDKSTWESESKLKHLHPLLDKFEYNKIPLKHFSDNNTISRVAINPTNPPNEKRFKNKKFKSFSKITQEIRKKREVNKIYYNRNKMFSNNVEGKKENIKDNSLSVNTPLSKFINNSLNESSYINNKLFSADLTIDIPSKIITMKLIENSVCCLVEWEVRTNGIIPEPSFLPADFLKDNYPLPLIEFYESNMRFVEKNN